MEFVVGVEAVGAVWHAVGRPRCQRQYVMTLYEPYYFLVEHHFTAIESSCVMRSESATSPLSSAAILSRTHSNDARLASEIGSAGFCGILSGFIGVPPFHNLKSRCGPVERPVLPTYPIISPCATRLPTASPLA